MKDFLLKARAVHGEKYTYPEKEKGWWDKIKIVCPEHGAFPQAPAKHIVRKQGCPACGKRDCLGNTGTSKWTKEEAVEKCRAVHGDRYDYSKLDWINTRVPINIICKLHGTFIQTFHNHTTHKTGCPVCNPSIRSLPKNTKASIKLKLRDGITVKEMFTKYVTLVCPKHGEFNKSRSNLRNKPGCPKCSFKGYSVQQTALKNWLLESSQEVIENYRYGVGKKELDLYIPEKKLAVEVDGIYWHATNAPQYKKLKHSEVRKRQLEKKEYCSSIELDLITILDEEWETKQEAVKNLLSHRLNLLPVVFGRKCSVENISHKEAKEFTDKYHLQQMTTASHYYALKYSNEIIACMSFRHRGATWEIARYVSNKKIPGGFQKLLAAFEKEHCPSKLISFCDSRLFKGSVYKEAGFTLEKTYSYNYKFVYRGKSYPREHFMRKNLPEEVQHLKLAEAYKKLKIHTLYLAPHMKFVKLYPE